MFKKAKNIDTAFRQTRLVCLAAILVSGFITCFTVYKSFRSGQQRKEQVLVMPTGKVIEAVTTDRKDNIMVEAKDHIKVFHQYFFTLSPDDKAIKASITKALYLADGSAKRQYDNLMEHNYYSNLISGNVSQSIRVDSVAVDLTNYPFRFTMYGVQEITRPTSIVERMLKTEGSLRNVPRSDNNPHGFLIENWRIVENRDIQIKNRER